MTLSLDQILMQNPVRDKRIKEEWWEISEIGVLVFPFLIGSAFFSSIYANRSSIQNMVEEMWCAKFASISLSLSSSLPSRLLVRNPSLVNLRLASHKRKFTKRNNETNHNCRKESIVTANDCDWLRCSVSL